MAEQCKGKVLSLYDYTGVAVTPWAKAGHECYCYDIQHDPDDVKEKHFPSGGVIYYVHADLHAWETICSLFNAFENENLAFAMAFPVCTDMAVSGAAHFATKAKKDKYFQYKAVRYAVWCAGLFDDLEVPYYIENPVSVLATKWRKPDYNFHPYEYGGYIPYDEAKHPRWPEYIAPFDAYPKKTCLWTGGGFKMPTKVAVDVPKGYSTQHKKLGGKSAKTKNIRSATPRGFAEAVFEANQSRRQIQ